MTSCTPLGRSAAEWKLRPLLRTFEQRPFLRNSFRSFVRSIEGERLLFAPREHIRETGRMNVYRDTPIPERFMRNEDRTNRNRRALAPVGRERQERRVELEVVREESEQSFSSYFFKSSFRVRTDDEDID